MWLLPSAPASLSLSISSPPIPLDTNSSGAAPHTHPEQPLVLLPVPKYHPNIQAWTRGMAQLTGGASGCGMGCNPTGAGSRFQACCCPVPAQSRAMASPGQRWPCPWALTAPALPAGTPKGPLRRDNSHCLDAGEAPETHRHPAQTVPPALSSGDFSLMAWRLILCRERKSKDSSGRPTHVTPIKSSSAKD